jgi:hypothetical protein
LEDLGVDEKNITVYLEEIRWEGMKQIHLAQNREQ